MTMIMAATVPREKQTSAATPRRRPEPTATRMSRPSVPAVFTLPVRAVGGDPGGTGRPRLVLRRAGRSHATRPRRRGRCRGAGGRDTGGAAVQLSLVLELLDDHLLRPPPGSGSGSQPGSGGITKVSSDSKCQGARSTSTSSFSLRSAPTAGRSSESMAGSKISSCASQSFSSSRQVGGDGLVLARAAVEDRRHLAVGASFQCGRSGCSSTTGPVASRMLSPAGSAPMMRTRPEW